jgi:hypothetical protein
MYRPFGGVEGKNFPVKDDKERKEKRREVYIPEE